MGTIFPAPSAAALTLLMADGRSDKLSDKLLKKINFPHVYPFHQQKRNIKHEEDAVGL